MSKLRIVNARIVNEGAVRAGDLLIDNGRIAAVGKAPDGNCATLDAAGAYLLPGMIDDQVHFREPGFTHKGDIASESAAAVAGGVTSYMEMPNCNPLTISQTTLDDKRRRAEGRSHANFAFYLGATNDNLEAIKSLTRPQPAASRCSWGPAPATCWSMTPRRWRASSPPRRS